MMKYILSNHYRRLSWVNEFNFRFAAPEDKLRFVEKKYDLDPEVLPLIEEADPTKKGVYIDWIARMFKRNKLRLPEDKDTIRDSLNIFDKFKKKGFFDSPKDINQYKTPGDLYEALDKYYRLEGVPEEQLKREQVEGATAIIREPEYTWYEVTTPEAACSLGSGSKWCTVQDRFAERYLRSGPLYILYAEGKPQIQVHIPSGSFMDKYDRSIFNGHEYNGVIYSYYDYDFIDSEFSEAVHELLDKLDVPIGEWYEFEQEMENEDMPNILHDLASDIEDLYDEGFFDDDIEFDSPEEKALLYLINYPESDQMQRLYYYLKNKTNSFYEVDMEYSDPSGYINTNELAKALEISDLPGEVFPNFYEESFLEGVEIEKTRQTELLEEFVEELEFMYNEGDFGSLRDFKERELDYILSNPRSTATKRLYSLLDGDWESFSPEYLGKVFNQGDERQLELF